MNCRDAERAVLLDADGALPARQRERLQAHMAQCAGCRLFAADVGALHRVMATPVVDAPEAVVDAVMAAAVKPAGVRMWFWRYGRVVLAAAAGLALLAGGWHGWRQGGTRAGVETVESRIECTSELLHALTSLESWFEAEDAGTGPVTDLESLAQQILSTQGMDIDFGAETGEEINSLEERQPTTLQWRNSPAPLAGRCG